MKFKIKEKDTPCKICNHDTFIWGVVDFNKTAEEINNTIVPYCGLPVYYHKCPNCGFLFTTDFDHWSKQEFSDNIYNEGYIVVDPEYDGRRSMRDVQQFLVNFPNKELKILDYGAGSSVFGNELKGHGYDVESWDPMWGTAPTWSTEKKFDLMTSFEVFEHTPTPKETLREMKQWLAPNGKIFITTLVNDVMGDKRDPMFWYLAPRNGHVCMHSMKSIDALFSQIDMTVQHFGPSWHLASCE